MLVCKNRLKTVIIKSISGCCPKATIGVGQIFITYPLINLWIRHRVDHRFLVIRVIDQPTIHVLNEYAAATTLQCVSCV